MQSRQVTLFPPQPDPGPRRRRFGETSLESPAESGAQHLYRQGLLAQAADRVDEAIALFDAALRLKPAFPEALCSGGYILQMRGFAGGALAFYDRALTFRPDYFLAWFNRGVLLLGARNFAAALESFEAACALDPGHAGAQANRGSALQELGRLGEAAQAQLQALELESSDPKIWLNLGNARMRLGQFHLAHNAYLRASELRPDYAEAICGMGIAAKEIGCLREALAHFERAGALAPHSEEIQANLGCLRLSLGDFAQGLEGYEYRWFNDKRLLPRCDQRFDLDWLFGAKILVAHDHGLGDTIQFFRYLPLLAERGAELTFACPPHMRRLLSSSGLKLAFRDDRDFAGDFDAKIALTSLPRAFATRLDTIPAKTPYLRAEAALARKWRRRMKRGRLNIGLCWRGAQDIRVDPLRSIPPRALAPLGDLDGVAFYSLTLGADLSELPDNLARRIHVFDDLDAGPDAFVDSAALIEQLDLVISCDTSIAHLAGALGAKSWVALRHAAEWRWLQQRADSPWYPTMRLFRCAEGDDWLSLIAEIAAEITAEIAAHSAAPKPAPRAAARPRKSGLRPPALIAPG